MKASLPAHTRPSAIACMLLAVLLAFGCAHPRLPLAPDLSLTGIDTGSLKNKVIVIDPGHGGPERGAVGDRGITESEVNLTVALHLWGLLRQAGASPVLTRSTDQALHAGPEFDLRSDLDLRARLGTDAAADLFVSIHHNAAVNRAANSLIVYYAMADPCGSLDAAKAVGKGLERRLGRESHSIQPGNYTVLRSSPAPAILGEASFISNRKNELDLAYSRTLAAEARGYFDGILDYCNRGMPIVRDLRAEDMGAAGSGPRILACLDPGHGSARVDAGSISATVNGKAARYDATENSCIEIAPPDLASGRYRACVAFRNTLGNSSQRCVDLTVALPPQRIEITSRFPVIPPDPAAAAAIDILVLDRLGRPVIDGTPVTVTASAGTLTQAETATNNGRVCVMLAAAGHAGTAILSAAAGNVRSSAQIRFAVPERALLSVWVRDADGQPVSDAALISGEQNLARSDRYGCIQAETQLAGQRQFSLARQGYEPCTITLNPAIGSMTVSNAVLQPIDGGAFLDRTIMLDPDAEETGAMPVLAILKSKIEHAGGRALLTWQDGPAPPCRERIMRAAAERADVFLCVNAAGRSCSVGHYHRSAAGLALAQLLQEAFTAQGLSGCKECTVFQSTHEAVIQTSMPALEVEVPRKLAHENPEAAAQAMYLALRQWLPERSVQTH